MKIENCWNLKLKISASSLTVSVIIFSDIILRFAVYCFNQHCQQCKGFFEQKTKNNNLKESSDFRVRTE